MKHWSTDASLSADTRLSWLSRFAAHRGWYWLASIAKAVGL